MKWLAAVALISACASAVPPGGGDGGGPGGGGHDMAHAVMDLAAPVDLAVPNDLTPPRDLMTPLDFTPTCYDGGATCMTGNPGACAFGVPLCDTGTRVCATVVGTQPCYDGPPTSNGVGICHGGNQTCVGALGSCDGEVTPAALENCFNDTDDDCDSRLNNGCPDHLVIGATRDLTSRGGPGGGPSSARCPAGSWVTHVKTWWDGSTGHASGVSIWCATPTLVRGASSYSVSLTPVDPQPYTAVYGTNHTDYNLDVDCGTAGFVGGYATAAYTDGTYVFGLGMYCASGTLTLNADNTLSVSLADDGVNGAWDYGATTFYFDACNTNEVLVGYDLRVGEFMDQMTAVCAPITVAYK